MTRFKIDKRLLWGFIAFSVLQLSLAWYSHLTPKSPHHKPEALDTFVPLGFTLVPIQIENQNEMESLINDFAIVDLHKKGVAEVIQSNVRLLRSPRNPNVFAVLVQQDKAKHLISKHGAVFTVALKNPDSKNKPKPQTRTIIRESL